MAQYAVPSPLGMIYEDENNGGDQYMSPVAVVVDEPASSGGGTFFLLFDLAWVLLAVALIGIAANY